MCGEFKVNTSGRVGLVCICEHPGNAMKLCGDGPTVWVSGKGKGRENEAPTAEIISG